MAAAGTLGATLSVSNTALVDIEGSADAIGDFSALTYDTEVGLIESIGEFGRVFAPVNFQAIKDGRMYKLKGGFDDGNIQMVVGQDLSDAGQANLKSYGNASNQNTYPFKITLVGADASFDTIYFGAKVMSYRTQMGSVNSVVKAAISLEINTPIFIGAT